MKKGTKYYILLILAVAICGIILYPLLDMLWYKFITHSEFEYSIYEHIVQPIIFALVYGIVYWLIDRKRNNKE